ncbi:MAG: hypothetical protein A4E57_02267 [Syntrophorhabdaceae bacterium PtaU1.Bin034]|jgi:predicted negative regulator of RcsB-dependent stress response|nr:MAG: hypothetical protein A4E57_02267 [Syntrophorhabdaceae bacterium PtaU1.Bin034]
MPTKKKIKEEIKKPDVLLTAFDRVTFWLKANMRTCIIIATIVVLAGLAGWGYAVYRANKDDKVQYLLSEGIRSFQEYSMAGKTESLAKAETTLKDVVRDGSSGIRDVAKLYLARIAVIKGAKEEARGLYNQILKNPSNDVVKRLSETGLQEIEKK